MAEPIPAATVVTVRQGAGGDGFSVLMVRRNDKVAFMAGAYVFPGGRVDPADRDSAHGDEAAAFRHAAVRELEEEAGVRADPDDLVPIAHWVTPDVESRRFDTHFFLARMPDRQEAKHDEGETTELAWLTPDEAIARCERDEILLPPPTWTTLKRLRPHRSIDDLFAWARTLTIPRVQPQLLKTDGQAMLTLPGDPTYPTIDGWVVPEETRFLLREGRWRALRAIE